MQLLKYAIYCKQLKLVEKRIFGFSSRNDNDIRRQITSFNKVAFAMRDIKIDWPIMTQCLHYFAPEFVVKQKK